MNPESTIVLVDDEPGMRKALGRLLEAEGLRVVCHASAEAFLAAPRPAAPWCLVLDVAMPGMGGLELQRRLTSGSEDVPVVFLTGHGDIPMSVRAMKSGAVDFLTKPVQADDLLAAVRAALDLAEARQRQNVDLAALRARFARLTPRECEVMRHVIVGKLNKQIAADIGASEQTVKVHRMRLMEKLGLRSVVDLVAAAARLGVDKAG